MSDKSKIIVLEPNFDNIKTVEDVCAFLKTLKVMYNYHTDFPDKDLKELYEKGLLKEKTYK